MLERRPGVPRVVEAVGERAAVASARELGEQRVVGVHDQQGLGSAATRRRQPSATSSSSP